MPRKSGWKKTEANKRRWTGQQDKGYEPPSKSKARHDDDKGMRPDENALETEKGMRPSKNAFRCSDTQTVKKYKNDQTISEHKNAHSAPEREDMSHSYSYCANKPTNGNFYENLSQTHPQSYSQSNPHNHTLHHNTAAQEPNLLQKDPLVQKCEFLFGTENGVEGSSPPYQHETFVLPETVKRSANPNFCNTVHGSFHQGHYQFLENAGKQCVANSCVSVIYDQIKHTTSWETDDLDIVIQTGDELYTFLQSSSTVGGTYLLVEELPNVVEIFGTNYYLTLGDPLVGFLSASVNDTADFPLAMSIGEALTTALSEYNSCFVTFGQATFAVMMRNDLLCVFDAHSRSSSGILTPEGTSIMITYNNLAEVYDHCLRLGESMNVDETTQFEVTGINVNAANDQSVIQHRASIPSNNSGGDDVIIENIESTQLYYYPVTLEICREIGNKLQLSNIQVNAPQLTHSVAIGDPCKTHSIEMDGNCFFRALSYAISGTENNHIAIRQATVMHMQENATDYQPFLRQGYTSVEEYITLSKVKDANTWATEMEILAASDLLRTDIFTFSTRWLKYSCSQISRTKSAPQAAIYLKHSHQCHYEVVCCVKQESVQNQTYCTGGCCVDTPGNIDSCPNTDTLPRQGARKQRRKAKREIDKRKRESQRQKRARAKLADRDKKVTVVDNSARFRKRYHEDEIYREAKRACIRDRYQSHEKFRESLKASSIRKYERDDSHRESVKAYSTRKYQHDEVHQQSVKAFSTRKYHEDEVHRESVKAFSTRKYHEDEGHRQSVKAYNFRKYQQDETHRESKKVCSTEKYAKDPAHREDVKQRNTVSRLQRLNSRRKMEVVTTHFRESISSAPDYICSVCNRRLFQKQVIFCNREIYASKGPAVTVLADKCISEQYLHRCSENCCQDCKYMQSPASKLWICFTCHRKLLSGNMPAEAAANNLHVEPIPEELKCLNTLEHHLTALHIPFLKMAALPKGGQHGVHGPMVSVPSNVNKVTHALPRSESDDQLIRVKLKRKLTYKHHYEYKYVKKIRIERALDYLTKNNKWYTDVSFNKDWVNPLSLVVQDIEQSPGTDRSDQIEISEVEAEEPDVNDHGIYMDTCLQPVDIGQEILDQYFDDILCVAPAEGNDPVKVLMDQTNEAKSFPVLFPTGSPTYHDDREAKITLARYLHTRLMLADSRFAKNTDYIFYAQYLSEVYQILSSVSIALRKSFLSAFGDNITPQKLMNKDALREILKCDDGYKFLKPIRGTPPFWQAAQKDLFAMLRQLGIPTWFCSFSSGDMRWTEILEAISREEGQFDKADDLDWSKKCAMLRNNPVTAARMFDHRFHCFLKEVIMSPAHPIGKIIDYFYRVEFQQRGSPHTHCLFWVEDAPKLDKDTDEEIANFIDQYVTCEIPSSDDDELYGIVNTVQKHSSRHSKSCKKKGTHCRFGYARPTSKRTFISRPDKAEDESIDEQAEVTDETESESMGKEEAKQILHKIKVAIEDSENSFETVADVFEHVGISQSIFEKACNKLANKPNVVLKRDPGDVWINQYNPDLLRCWNANMDIQYITDAYSCVVYIISYISKSEREMGLLLDHARKEALDGSEDAKQAMKKLGGVYIHNREISAQEAVYRVCNMHLKESSRKVQFVPTGNNPVRMSLPLQVLQDKCQRGDVDVDDIWMTSLVDRYKSRPKDPAFDDICLASFCSEYRPISKSEMSKVKPENRQEPVHELQNDLGHVQKRSRTDPAVIRYARFSPTTEPEKYYQSMLQLFLPYRMDVQLKPDQFQTFQNFYEVGAVKHGNNSVEAVRNIVDQNKAMFEKDAALIDKAEEMLENCGPLEDAWAQICPESEAVRLECLSTRKDTNAEPEDDGDIPDLVECQKRERTIELRQCVIPRDEAQKLCRLLNEKQREIFYTVRQWCLNKRNGNNPTAFHVFVTGGAGTGKTHLIKCIQYEATRLLAPTLPNPDDVSVLLTAPTGVAAFNINAATIHNTFSIPVDARLPYQPLGDEKINSLRSMLSSLQILIIDEVSMLDQKLLAYIHGRLRQIKQCRDYSPFANVSIVAVGDFYQLPPVKGKKLYADNPGENLWIDTFCIAELTEIMRQKDGDFAKTLNRLRTRKKPEPLNTMDVDALCKRETGEDSDAIHIFATNKQVDMHNLAKLHSSCTDLISIEAQDFYRDAKSGKLEKKQGHHIKVFNTNLARRVTLAVNARVMLTKNIDVSDGLVNGAFGTVSNIVQDPGSDFPSLVYVVFDNEKVGVKLRKQKPSHSCLPNKSTPITIQEDRVTNSGGVRRQFPLKLAFACTVHKMQGTTLKAAVVSLSKIFTAGQAYVALSRVTSLQGLIIQDFKDSSIYGNENVEEAIRNMPAFISLPILPNQQERGDYKLALHNIEGVKSHVEDLRFDDRLLDNSFIFLTETWLTNEDPQGIPEINRFSFQHRPRQQCYDSSEPIYAELKQQIHGGVGIYHRTNVDCEILQLKAFNLEYLAVYLADRNIIVAVIYRPASYPLNIFRQNLVKLLSELDTFRGGCVVMGDFNEDMLKSSSVAKLMSDHGFLQHVTQPTTENGTLIDHVYVKRVNKVHVQVLPTYYSYHESISVEL